MNETEDHRKSWRVPCFLGCATQALVVLITIVVLGIYVNNKIQNAWDHGADLKEVAQVTGLQFPRSTRLIYGTIFSFRDTTCSTKVEMNKSDVDAFVHSVRAVSAKRGVVQVSRTLRLGIVNGGTNPWWWDPDSQKKFIAVQWTYRPLKVESGGVREQNMSVFIGLDDPRKAVAFIYYFSG